MAKKDNPGVKGQGAVSGIENIKERLDMLDQRLDSIDSMVTAVIERVMSQPITLDVTCSHCGNNIEIAIIGNKKLVT